MAKQGWKKNFFLIWTGQAVSQLSSSILQFAIVWYLTYATGSPLVLSMAMLAGFLPRALLGPFIGVFIDRYNRKKIMIMADLFIALVSLTLVGASFFTEGIPQGLIYGVLLLRAVGTAFHEPTLQAVTPQIVPKEELARCAGYSQSLESISQILSPALAAFLYSATSLNTIILLDVAGACFAVGTLLFTKIPPLQEKRVTNAKDVIVEAREGWDLLKSRKGLLGLVFVSTLYSVAMMPISALFPLMSISFFGGNTRDAGNIEVIFAIGLLLGSLVLSITGGSKNKVHSIVFSCLLMTLSLFVTGFLLPNQFSIFVICAFFMGVSGPFFWGMFRALLQQGFQHEYLGRVMALTSSITVIASPVGMIISGLFTEAVGAQKWFLIAGGMTLLSAILCMAIPAIRHCETEDREVTV